jgi:succinate dehydrogenase / fumarate reductase, cytochrome b subunit
VAELDTLDSPQKVRSQFFWRRLHSLSGVLPIGVFLLEHLLTNSRAFGVNGRDTFNSQVAFLHDLPFLLVLEIFGIFLPLAFHSCYGMFIAFTGRHNVLSYPYMNNIRYILQRYTGYIAFTFILLHLTKYRFAHWFGGVNYMEAGPDYFEITRRGLMEWYLPPWATLAIYLVGTTAAVYHFANGLWTFSITWGLVIGPLAQRKFSYFCASIGGILLIMAYMSLYAFATAKPGQFPQGNMSVVTSEQRFVPGDSPPTEPRKRPEHRLIR